MPPYLLKRRLRHVRSIAINNISAAIRKKSEGRLLPFSACFLALQTMKGESVYVSEVKKGFINNIQFSEVPVLDSSLSHVLLKILVKLPKECDLTEVIEQNGWLILREVEIDFNKLQSVDVDDKLEGVNVPLFEMNDGFYTLQDQPVIRVSEKDAHLRHKRNASRNQVQDSFSFNSALKLNIMISYKAQVLREIQEISAKLEYAIKLDGGQRSWLVQCLKRYIGDLEQSIRLKRGHLLELKENSKSSIGPHAKLSDSSLDVQSLHEFYGSNYPNMIKIKDRLESLRLKKLSRLISIFQTTYLFQKEVGFMEYENSGSTSASFERAKLKLVDKERILAAVSKSDKNRDLINSCLGYYLLFVQLAATTILQIPLPYRMKFQGSTSMIDNKCLYFNDLSSARHPEAELNAIECFNRNLIQVIQRWGHHVSPKVGDQISQLENH